jgi:hypothetical protein
MWQVTIFFSYLVICLTLALCCAPLLNAVNWFGFAEPIKVLTRLAQIFMIVGLWPFLSFMNLQQRASLGYACSKHRFLISVIQGWLLGVTIMGSVVALLLVFGVRVPEQWNQEFIFSVIPRIPQALIGGLLIAVIEETFFRGALFTALRRHHGVWSTAIWSALLYAMIHFMKPTAVHFNETIAWQDLLQLWLQILTAWLPWPPVDAWFALVLAGLFLTQIRALQGHLGWCIGIHAGWVFVIQVTRKLTDSDPTARWSWLACDHYDAVTGWLAAALLSILIMIVIAINGYRTRIARRATA